MAALPSAAAGASRGLGASCRAAPRRAASLLSPCSLASTHCLPASTLAPTRVRSRMHARMHACRHACSGSAPPRARRRAAERCRARGGTARRRARPACAWLVRVRTAHQPSKPMTAWRALFPSRLAAPRAAQGTGPRQMRGPGRLRSGPFCGPPAPSARGAGGGPHKPQKRRPRRAPHGPGARPARGPAPARRAGGVGACARGRLACAGRGPQMGVRLRRQFEGPPSRAGRCPAGPGALSAPLPPPCSSLGPNGQKRVGPPPHRRACVRACARRPRDRFPCPTRAPTAGRLRCSARGSAAAAGMAN
eukprot:scaffold317_cov379-Prasinococcus_capsulatus_cf.AAC.5